MPADQSLAIVYVLTNPAMPGFVKIGRTYTNGVEARISQLYTTGVPFPFQVEFACRVPNPEEVESALHLAFGPNRVNPRREFFEIDRPRPGHRHPQTPPRRRRHRRNPATDRTDTHERG